jgi:succinate dehydrogenase/fumarate reductase flavoprotein subunit
MGQSYHLSDGVWSDGTDCETAVKGLYAAGDCLGARSGYPMAGFAAAFCAVSGARAGTNAARFADAAEDFALDQAVVKDLKETLWAPMGRKGGFTPRWTIQVIQDIVTPYWVLMYKSEHRLAAALENILFIRDNILPQLIAYDNHDLRLCHEVRSIVLHVEMKLRASMFRKESRWYHYREDYPLRDDENWLCWIKIQQDHGEMELVKVPVPEKWRPDPSQPYAERYPVMFPNEPDVLPD